VDELVNRARAQSPAANVALPAVLAPPSLRSSGPSVENEDPFDRYTHAKIAQLAGGFSPMGVAEAAFDWALHLAASPGRQAALALSALSKQTALLQPRGSLSSEGSGGNATSAAADDRRFAAEEWRYWPFSLYAEGFLATQRWWDEATSQIHGATRHHLSLLKFIARQALDTVAPSNFLLTNPVALKQTLSEGGANLMRGAIHFSADLRRLSHNERSEAVKAFVPGKTVALTKGVVVKRTDLAEIIQNGYPLHCP
jgi:polyhydroxyalkanoate synthase subunit PhaC